VEAAERVRFVELPVPDCFREVDVCAGGLDDLVVDGDERVVASK
jgi:hypothetical protein